MLLIPKNLPTLIILFVCALFIVLVYFHLIRLNDERLECLLILLYMYLSNWLTQNGML